LTSTRFGLNSSKDSLARQLLFHLDHVLVDLFLLALEFVQVDRLADLGLELGAQLFFLLLAFLQALVLALPVQEVAGQHGQRRHAHRAQRARHDRPQAGMQAVQVAELGAERLP
jgi:hypothetical protein